MPPTSVREAKIYHLEPQLGCKADLVIVKPICCQGLVLLKKQDDPIKQVDKKWQALSSGTQAVVKVGRLYKGDHLKYPK